MIKKHTGGHWIESQNYRKSEKDYKIEDIIKKYGNLDKNWSENINKSNRFDSFYNIIQNFLNSKKVNYELNELSYNKVKINYKVEKTAYDLLINYKSSLEKINEKLYLKKGGFKDELNSILSCVYINILINGINYILYYSSDKLSDYSKVQSQINQMLTVIKNIIKKPDNLKTQIFKNFDYKINEFPLYFYIDYMHNIENTHESIRLEDIEYSRDFSRTIIEFSKFFSNLLDISKLKITLKYLRLKLPGGGLFNLGKFKDKLKTKEITLPKLEDSIIKEQKTGGGKSKSKQIIKTKERVVVRYENVKYKRNVLIKNNKRYVKINKRLVSI